MKSTRHYTFRGASLRDALLKAQENLGPQALFVSHRDLPRGGGPSDTRMVEVTVTAEEAGGAAVSSEVLLQELRQIKSELRATRLAARSGGLSKVEQRLRARGVGRRVRLELLEALGEDEPDRVEFEKAIASRIPVGFDRLETGGSRRVLSLVGPTGVGKTTTLAKLAGGFALRGGGRVALVTIDTYRVAATEQLRAYADMLRASFRVAFTPEDLRRTLEDLDDCSLVLIDTTGRSPLDDPRVRQLGGYLDGQPSIETLLVLSATMPGRLMIEAWRRFGTLRLSGLVFTKLDESLTYGHLLDVALPAKVPIAFLATGQEVPEDIEEARSGRLARLILDGRRVLSHRSSRRVRA